MNRPIASPGWHAVLAAAIVVTAWTVGAAAPLSVTATIDRDRMEVGGRAILTVTVSGDEVGSVDTPPIPNQAAMSVSGPHGPSRSQNIQFVNGSLSRNVTVSYTYYLDARTPGELAIPALPIIVDGKRHLTKPIRLSVGRSRLQGGSQIRPIDMQVRLSSMTAYPGQAVTVEYRLREYERARVTSRSIAEEPNFVGVWIEKLFDARQEQSPRTREVVNGVAYTVMPILKVAISPTTAGTVTIPSMAMSGGVATATGRRDFFGQPQYRSTNVTARSAEHTLEVRPLPPEPPPGFEGAVGNFRLTGSVDRTQVDQGDPVTWTVVLAGQGNLNAVGELRMSSLAGFRAYDPEVTTAIDKSGMSFGGRKTYERVLIPLHAGAVDMPSASFVFLDPEAGEYRTVATPRTVLTVKRRAEDAPGGAAMSLTPSEVRQVGSDIRFILPNADALADQTSRVWDSSYYWYLHAIAPMLVVVAAGMRFRRRRLGSDPGRVRALASRSEGQKRLRTAQKHLKREEHPDAIVSVASAILDLVAAHAGLSAAGLTSPQVAEELRAREVQDDAVERVVALLGRCDRARYAPSADERSAAVEICNEGSELIGLLIRDLESWDERSSR